MIFNKDRIGALLLLAFAIFYLRGSLKIDLDPSAVNAFFTPRTLPISLSVIAIICSLIQLLMPAPKSQSDAQDNSTKSIHFSYMLKEWQWKPVFFIIVLMTGYALLFSYLGFLIATFGFLIGGFYILGERRLLIPIAIAGSLALGMWLFLTQLFDLYLDPGDLYRLFTL